LVLDRLRQVVRQRALEKSANEVQFKISGLGSEAASLGAARLASERILELLYAERA